MPDPDNSVIADQLEGFAALLELSGANPFAARSYRRAADVVRVSPLAVAELVRKGCVRSLRGIGPGIEARLRELVETGQIAELTRLERQVRPELVSFARAIGMSAKRMAAIADALGLETVGDLRAAAAAGVLRDVPGIGGATEQRIKAGLTRPASPSRGLPLQQARLVLGDIASRLQGTVAGDARRWRDMCHSLVVVKTAEDASATLERFASLPQIVAVVEQDERRAVGLGVDGLALALVVSHPGEAGTVLVRETGSPEYVASLGPLPAAASEEELYATLGRPWLPPELREGRSVKSAPRGLLELADIRGDLHVHTTWSDGRASVLEIAEAASARGYGYVAICDHTPAVGVVRGLTADDLKRQGEEIERVNERLAPFTVLRGVECDILADGTLDVDDATLEELDWVQVSLHAGQRAPREAITGRVVEAMRNPYVRALSHPTGRLLQHRPPNALDLERVYEVCLETGVALEVNGLPARLDLPGERVREAVQLGVSIVVSTDAHSVAGLSNMELAVRTARRGFAPADSVVNTRPLADVRRGVPQ
jgi:DNA polymerase (family 10)